MTAKPTMSIAEMRASLADQRSRANDYPDSDKRVLAILEALVARSEQFERRLDELEFEARSGTPGSE